MNTPGVVLVAALATAAMGIVKAAGPLRVAVEPFVTLPADVRHPEGLVAHPVSGEIYVGTFDAREPAGARHNQLLRYTAQGRLLARKDFGSTPLTGLAYADGHVYILNFGASKLQRIEAAFTATSAVVDVADFKALSPTTPAARTVTNPDGSQDSLSFGSSGFPAPNGMVFDRAGNLYVSDSFQGALYRIAGATACAPCEVVTFSRDPLLATAGALPFGANGLAFNADETRLYINNAGDHRVLRMSMPAGPVDVLAESIPGADGLLFHQGLLWVAANQADQVLGLDETGRTVVRAGEFLGITADGRPRGLLFPAGTAVMGPWMVVANLALPLTPAIGDEWEEQVRRWTLARFRIPPQRPAAP